MTKQAMTTLVQQCEAWGMVERIHDAGDARAKSIRFTATGLAWLQAYRDAVTQAEQELRQAVGTEVATVIHLGLEAYSGA
jgi:DNA-binding MarR family transcriptional regulator